MVMFGAVTGEIKNGIVKWKNKNGADAANALLYGIGTSADPSLTSTAGKVFKEFRCKTTATSGDNRLQYMRFEIAGAGASGECIRAFSKISAAAATVRGAHISLDVSSTGSASGLGVGVDGQILVFDGALTGGTYASLNSEIYSAGSSTDVSGVTEISFLRFSNGGDSTGVANVDDNAFLFVLTGGAVASGNIVEADIDETKFSHKFRVKAHGTTYYLMATAT